MLARDTRCVSVRRPLSCFYVDIQLAVVRSQR